MRKSERRGPSTVGKVTLLWLPNVPPSCAPMLNPISAPSGPPMTKPAAAPMTGRTMPAMCYVVSA